MSGKPSALMSPIDTRPGICFLSTDFKELMPLSLGKSVVLTTLSVLGTPLSLRVAAMADGGINMSFKSSTSRLVGEHTF